MSDINLDIRTEGPGPGQHRRQKTVAPPNSRLGVDHLGNQICIPMGAALTCWEYDLATALAVGYHPMFIKTLNGLGSASRSSSFGMMMASGSVNGGYALVTAVPDCSFQPQVYAKAKVEFQAQVRGSATESLLFVGLSEDLAAVDPSVGSGDSAGFMFDDAESVTTGLTTAQHQNWILSQSVNGTDTYIDSGVAHHTNQRNYNLEIKWDLENIPSWYIDGALVGTGVETQAFSDLSVKFGAYNNTSGPATSATINCRYVYVNENWWT